MGNNTSERIGRGFSESVGHGRASKDCAASIIHPHFSILYMVGCNLVLSFIWLGQMTTKAMGIAALD
jgi:hypothetical protein